MSQYTANNCFLVSILAIFLLARATISHCKSIEPSSLSTSLQTNNDEQAFIHDAKPGEYPFMVSLVYDVTYSYLCAGTLINHKTVLTAAHCVDENKSGKHILVLVGAHNLYNFSEPRLEFSIDNIAIHPDYRKEKLNDIALLKLNSSVDFKKTKDGIGSINSIKLVKIDDRKALAADSVHIVNWEPNRHHFRSQVLQHDEYEMKSVRDHPEPMRNGLRDDEFFFMVDHENKLLNLGHFGQPLFLINSRTDQAFQIGIASHPLTVKRKDNSWTNIVYTKVSQYNDWIDKTAWV